MFNVNTLKELSSNKILKDFGFEFNIDKKNKLIGFYNFYLDFGLFLSYEISQDVRFGEYIILNKENFPINIIEDIKEEINFTANEFLNINLLENYDWKSEIDKLIDKYTEESILSWGKVNMFNNYKFEDNEHYNIEFKKNFIFMTCISQKYIIDLLERIFNEIPLLVLKKEFEKNCLSLNQKKDFIGNSK